MIITYQLGDKVVYTSRGGMRSDCTITGGPYGSEPLYDATRDADSLVLEGHMSSDVPVPGKFAPRPAV